MMMMMMVVVSRSSMLPLTFSIHLENVCNQLKLRCGCIPVCEGYYTSVQEQQPHRQLHLPSLGIFHLFFPAVFIFHSHISQSLITSALLWSSGAWLHSIYGWYLLCVLGGTIAQYVLNFAFIDHFLPSNYSCFCKPLSNRRKSFSSSLCQVDILWKDDGWAQLLILYQAE